MAPASGGGHFFVVIHGPEQGSGPASTHQESVMSDIATSAGWLWVLFSTGGQFTSSVDVRRSLRLRSASRQPQFPTYLDAWRGAGRADTSPETCFT